MRGKLIVIEGIDGSGKSTIIAEAVKQSSKWHHKRGFTHNSPWDSFIHAHPQSILYYLDMAWKTQRILLPLLKRGEIVLQDRYVQTIDSYLPDATYGHNAIMRRILEPSFIRPDAYVFCDVPASTAIRRLKGKPEEYHDRIAAHPELLEQRREEYQKIYNAIQCKKTVLDTTRPLQHSVRKLTDIVLEVTACS